MHHWGMVVNILLSFFYPCVVLSFSPCIMLATEILRPCALSLPPGRGGVRLLHEGERWTAHSVTSIWAQLCVLRHFSSRTALPSFISSF